MMNEDLIQFIQQMPEQNIKEIKWLLYDMGIYLNEFEIAIAKSEGETK